MRIDKLARVIRSKNASPFLTTIDFFFDSDDDYHAVRDSAVLNPGDVAELLGIPAADVLRVQFHDEARGAKISVVKSGHSASGDPDVADVFGAQQYVPLLALEVSWPDNTRTTDISSTEV